MSSKGVSISVKGLSKSYRIQHDQDRAITVAEASLKWLRNPFRRATYETFAALHDISFDVKKGEVLGVIGHNGAGKSTLLKILSRITEPTSGRIDLYGRVASLLEVGTGFHPELTGNENIYLNGAILGMTKREIKEQFDAIVDFAEVEQFLDTPVKRYSSGMYVRLAFAVAAHLNPEILVVDEVLSVGDVAFQQKCMGKMRDIGASGDRTVIFVSHSMEAINTLCDRCVLLNAGQVAMQGTPGETTRSYLENNKIPTATDWEGDAGDEHVRLRSARILGGVNGVFRTDEPLRLRIVAEVCKPINGLVFAVEVYAAQRHQLLAYSAFDDQLQPPCTTTPVGLFVRELVIPANTLSSGKFEIKFDIGIHNIKKIITNEGSLRFNMENLNGIGRRFQHDDRNTIFRPNWSWLECGDKSN